MTWKLMTAFAVLVVIIVLFGIQRPSQQVVGTAGTTETAGTEEGMDAAVAEAVKIEKTPDQQAVAGSPEPASGSRTSQNYYLYSFPKTLPTPATPPAGATEGIEGATYSQEFYNYSFPPSVSRQFHDPAKQRK